MIRIILAIIYILAFSMILIMQGGDEPFLLPRHYGQLALIGILFYIPGLVLSYLRGREKKGQYNFVWRFFVAFGYSGFVVGLIQIFRGEYYGAVGALTVCTGLLMGMHAKYPFRFLMKKEK